MIREEKTPDGYPRAVCDHEGAVRVERRVLSNGSVIAGEHCQDCNSWHAIPKSGVNVEALPEYSDLSQASKLAKRQRELWDGHEAWRNEKREREKEEKSTEFWQRHDAYMKTPEWAERRQKVFKRSGGVCEACMVRRARHVHHTTYEHLGYEPLWELRAVCVPCHDALTEHKRVA